MSSLLVAESLIEQSCLYLNVNSNASHTEGCDVLPAPSSFTSSTVYEEVYEEVYDTMSSLCKWLLALCPFILAHRWRGCLTFQQIVNRRRRESRRTVEQMRVYGGGIPSLFDYGPLGISMVCSACFKPTSISITANLWLQLRPWNLWGWHRDENFLRWVLFEASPAVSRKLP